MNLCPTFLLTTALLTSGLPALQPIATSKSVETTERAALESLETPALETLRAAGDAPVATLNDVERSALRQLERSDLEQQRAGDLHLTDRELTIVAIVLGVVVLIAIIA